MSLPATFSPVFLKTVIDHFTSHVLDSTNGVCDAIAEDRLSLAAETPSTNETSQQRGAV